jgi:cytoskeleton protein RodZ
MSDKMSLTLGEKLRQAREERDISISEVAEQTRISPLYIEAIENDDYSPLPGGIFNKGFIKSFAKFVGVDEDEALQDYSRQLAQQNEGQPEADTKTYRPEVLTDDRSRSLLPTIIFAAIILGLMTFGILALVRYIQDQQNQPVAANSNTATNAVNTNTANADSGNTNTVQSIPATNEIKVEFKPVAEPISVEATVDGRKSSVNVMPGSPQIYTGQQSVRLRYYKGFADKVQLTVNGKQITPPPAPAKGQGIEFEINKENIMQILQSGQFATGAANTNSAAR